MRPSIKISLLKILAFSIILMIVVLYFYKIFKYSINFPYFDDYHTVLHFLNSWRVSDSFEEYIILIFQQHNEHRVAFSRLMALIDYKVFGEVNFRRLILLGNTAMIILLAILYKCYNLKNDLRLLYFIPVALILFNFRYVDLSFWAMATFSSIWVFAFAILSFYFLYKNQNKHLFIALLFATLATFSIANGMFVFITGAIILFFKKENLSSIYWLWPFLGAVFISLYFFNYTKPINTPAVSLSILTSPLQFLNFIWAFLGSAVSNDLHVAIPIGILLFGFILFTTFKRSYRDSPVLYSLILFIMITACAAALARSGSGLKQALSPRYALYSTLLICCCYLLFIRYIQKFKFAQLTIIPMIVISLYFNYKTERKYLVKKIDYAHQFNLYKQQNLNHFDMGWYIDRREIPKKIAKISDSLRVFNFSKIKNYSRNY